MPSVITHAVAATALGKIFTRKRLPPYFWVLAVLSAILPDVDYVGHLLGVPYSSLWGHRGLTHSLLFAALWGGIVGCLFSGRRVVMAAFFFAVTASHGVLDALTDGGLGVAFFAPFDTKRYFLPWRPIPVSPLGIARFASLRGIHVLAWELVLVWVPLWTLALVVNLHRNRQDKKRGL